jgi:squalene-hopene/tetraprenyl-beta-curcumene cyclase
MRAAGVLAACLAAALPAACSHVETPVTGTWSPKAAAAYLDRRETWWMGWRVAARDHDTFCVSCHTAVPYALSRLALRDALADHTPSVTERRLLENVTKRVRLWQDVGPYYSDEKDGARKTAESRGTEAVLNALILAVYDAREGRLTDDARAAFDNMWALQETDGDEQGGWPWLDFGLRPWEAKDSPYYGAALAALAVGTAPESYRSAPAIQDRLKLLRDYLARKYPTQSVLNRTVLLWASTKWPGLMEPERQQSLVADILQAQRADGGWSLSTLVGTGSGTSAKSDGTALEMKSDGYATGLVTFTLQQAGSLRDRIELENGLSWLVRHQIQPEGLWPADSLNKRRNPGSDIGRFMSDAATAYAVLGLTAAERRDAP